jgi:apolipoprotein N-acyltransferase
VLLLAPSVSGRLAFLAAFAARALGGLCIWRYLSIPLPTWIILTVLVFVPAGVFGLGVVLYRASLRSGALWQAVLALPCLWIAFEYLSALLSPHGTFGSLGYTQMDFLPVIQIASLAGIWAISFCPLLFSSTVAVVFSGKGSASGTRMLAATAAAFLVLVVCFGIWRLHSTPPLPRIGVGLIASGSMYRLSAAQRRWIACSPTPPGKTTCSS